MPFPSYLNPKILHFYYLFCSNSFFFQYLSRQNASLREVNESRTKIYEQLEETLTELESTNRAMASESREDKAKIKR